MAYWAETETSLRWQIEVYFRTLKSGCRIEERQFEFLERELNAIAVYLLVAGRLRHFGLDCNGCTISRIATILSDRQHERMVQLVW